MRNRYMAHSAAWHKPRSREDRVLVQIALVVLGALILIEAYALAELGKLV